MEDSSIKGVIELSEVEAVKLVPHKSVQGAPKKMDESAFFEVSIPLQVSLYPIKWNGISHAYQLDQSISVLRVLYF